MKKKYLILIAFILLLPGVVFAINQVTEGFRVNTSTQKVDAWGICRMASSTTNGKDYFIPTKTLSEWQSVINNKPGDMSLTSCVINGVCNPSAPNPAGSNCSDGQAALCSSGTLTGCYNVGNQDGLGYTCSGSGGGSSASCYLFWCLTADTLITMEGGTKKLISELTVGERVVGQTGINTITIERHFTTYDYVYGINGSTPFVTGGHPFMTKRGWRAINPEKTPQSVKTQINPNKLEVGDEILLENGKYTKIETITPSKDKKGTVVYNPGVDGDNTYYANGMLVHNK